MIHVNQVALALDGAAVSPQGPRKDPTLAELLAQRERLHSAVKGFYPSLPLSTDSTTPRELEVAGLENVISALAGGIRREALDAAVNASDQMEVAEALDAVADGNADGFYMPLQYPFVQMLEGLAQMALPGSEAGQFLLTNSKFVETQFLAVIQRHEGSLCCFDKAGFLLNSLLDFFKSGKEIVFDTEQKYTFHLPKKVFTTQTEIVVFFDAVYCLYYGQTGPFVKILAAIDAKFA
jgi:hypothetical protein